MKPFELQPGLSADIVREISVQKNENSWMQEFRLAALQEFLQRPMPLWGPDLSDLDIHNLCYYVRTTPTTSTTWQDVPQDIKKTFDALGISQAEQYMLAGVGAQFESELVYKSLLAEYANQGVIFCDISQALREHPELVRKYFATVIPAHDNKFAALNSAVWSGGSFLYVPAGVRIEKPLQAYFRIDRERMGQFERTLIIAEPGSFVHYVEGCSAPVYTTNSLHSAVVEIIALPGSHVRYTTIQNWSTNVYNLVTKRAIVHEGAFVEWIDGNFGSAVTMKYPCIMLAGARAKGTVISLAMAGKKQCQDAGAKIIHNAPNTSSTIISKSISCNGGRSTYRGLVTVTPTAVGSTSHVQCDALLLDGESRTDTYPTIRVNASPVTVRHEASVSKLNELQMFYLMSRGLSEQEAATIIVHGFMDLFVQQLPMEYAVEINRLIAHEMEGSVG